MELDDIDKRILGILQVDATQSIQEIADDVGLTTNPCWRRIKRLEDSGVITGRIATINWAKLGLSMTAFARIHTTQHSKDWLSTFKKSVNQIPEIVECHRMTGEVDYLLKIVVRDLAHYDLVYQRLIKLVPSLSDVSSAFSMELLKSEHRMDLTASGAS
ncbi:MAG: Lrp/AsnC family transcriptional regulator [Pseudomonadota bacterium]|nr:Lrp/AsnC family transcriptional regulator [Pseudomonadota bacterium]